MRQSFWPVDFAMSKSYSLFLRWLPANHQWFVITVPKNQSVIMIKNSTCRFDRSTCKRFEEGVAKWELLWTECVYLVLRGHGRVRHSHTSLAHPLARARSHSLTPKLKVMLTIMLDAILATCISINRASRQGSTDTCSFVQTTPGSECQLSLRSTDALHLYTCDFVVGEIWVRQLQGPSGNSRQQAVWCMRKETRKPEYVEDDESSYVQSLVGSHYMTRRFM